MFPSKFFSNNSLDSRDNSCFSLSTVSSLNFGPTYNMELYPRRRPTEFYYDPQPMEEYQSRNSEHPQDKLHKATNSRFRLETISEEQPKWRINPPRNSDTRVLRNSYFS